VSISGVNTYSSYFCRPANIATSGSNSPSFASVLGATAADANKSSAGSVETTDFTHMTRKDLAEWVNTKIKNGEMSLDGSEAFMGMTMKMPVNGAYAGLDDSEQVNFMQSAQDGMAWARQHSDGDMLKSLEAALGTMQKYQGQVSGVNLTA